MTGTARAPGAAAAPGAAPRQRRAATRPRAGCGDQAPCPANWSRHRQHLIPPLDSRTSDAPSHRTPARNFFNNPAAAIVNFGARLQIPLPFGLLPPRRLRLALVPPAFLPHRPPAAISPRPQPCRPPSPNEDRDARASAPRTAAPPWQRDTMAPAPACQRATGPPTRCSVAQIAVKDVANRWGFAGENPL